MDALLDQRWRAGLSPLDGDCLRFDDALTVEELQALMAAILPELEKQHSSQTLYTFDDWHQHDGFISPRNVVTWESIKAVVQSEETLTGTGDAYVYRAFYPENLSFLLRYDVSDENSSDYGAFLGDFDLSSSSPMVAQITSHVPPGLLSRLRVDFAKSYFDKTYSG